jgi:carbamoyl-phosphate synthase large subunit
VPDTAATGLLIGAGPEQLAALAVARAQGCRLVVVDGDANAPGLALADMPVVVDLRDIDAVVAVARRHQVHFTIPAPIGPRLVTQAAVHEALSLRGVGVEAARVCTDKQLFHRHMLTARVTMPSQCELRTREALLQASWSDLCAQLGTAVVVVKPPRGSGSRDVLVMEQEADWRAMTRQALSAFPEDGLLVQAFVDGLVLGVDGGVVDGKVVPTLIREKCMSPRPHRVELAYRASARIDAVVAQRVVALVTAAIDALEVRHAPFHADVVVTPAGQPVLIEMAMRPSGLRLASDLIPACTGVSFLEEALSLHRFGHGRFAAPVTRPALLHYWHHPGGRVRRVPTPRELLDIPQVLSAEVHWQPGQLVRMPTTVAELLRGGHLLVAAEDWATVEDSLAAALSRFEVTVDG